MITLRHETTTTLEMHNKHKDCVWLNSHIYHLSKTPVSVIRREFTTQFDINNLEPKAAVPRLKTSMSICRSIWYHWNVQVLDNTTVQVSFFIHCVVIELQLFFLLWCGSSSQKHGTIFWNVWIKNKRTMQHIKMRLALFCWHISVTPFSTQGCYGDKYAGARSHSISIVQKFCFREGTRNNVRKHMICSRLSNILDSYIKSLLVQARIDAGAFFFSVRLVNSAFIFVV